jgi:hypothetical protein
MQKKFLFLILAFCLTACRRLPSASSEQALQYDFQHPDRVWELNSSLEEVSGNAFDSIHGGLMLVQDEDVALYRFDLATGKTHPVLVSGREGDIEDLAYHNGTWVLLESDGLIWCWQGDSLRSVRTALTAANDAEGLCHDPRTGKWLIALKGDPGLGGSELGGRAVYALDLERVELEVFLTIDPDKIAATKAGAARLGALPSRRSKKRDTSMQGSLTRLFEPSGIALDTVTGDCYVLSAASALIAVYDSAGGLRAVHALPEQILPKAEGICFGPKGALYISSEAQKGKPARLAEFFPKR